MRRWAGAPQAVTTHLSQFKGVGATSAPNVDHLVKSTGPGSSRNRCGRYFVALRTASHRSRIKRN